MKARVNEVEAGKQRIQRTPTALPKRKRAKHSKGKVFAKAANTPNKEVKKSVALKAVVRPMRSEPGRRE